MAVRCWRTLPARNDDGTLPVLLKSPTVEPAWTARWPCEEYDIAAKAPINAVGAGRYLASIWNET